jgi:hypothetical protein
MAQNGSFSTYFGLRSALFAASPASSDGNEPIAEAKS